MRKEWHVISIKKKNPKSRYQNQVGIQEFTLKFSKFKKMFNSEARLGLIIDIKIYAI